MRKVMIWFLIMLFTLSMVGSAFAKPANIIDALATANDELRSKNDGTDYFGTVNKQGKLINEANWAKNSLFSYGTPQEASQGSNNFDPGTNQYRYHGYTMNGEKYTNTFFRNDTSEIVNVNSANWILRPWSNDSVQNFVINVMHEPKLEQINPFNNDPDLLESINRGFENLKDYNPYIKFERTGKQWQEYVHVLQPPTEYTFGMGRLFRLVGGQMRYLT
ncbi:Athe_2463 domain-containing protein, partial [Desulforamulus ruminis]|uniref:Athe_2463 domain-containing protein n=1 Tax=Desulforamulus ruminis TaxID=1564 RepID=UPI003B5A09F9